MRKRGIRFSKAISLGNETNIDIADALEFLGEDEQTKAIILYIEGIRDGQKFMEVARKITPHKPVLAQYVGGSASGARAGMSHTGAMAGPDFLYDGIFKQAGIIRVDSVEELYDHGWTLATQPPPQGSASALSPTPAVLQPLFLIPAIWLDWKFPVFPKVCKKKSGNYLQPHASSANPVDLTFDVGMEKLAITIPELVMKSGEVDAIVIHGVMMTGFLREIYHSSLRIYREYFLWKNF